MRGRPGARPAATWSLLLAAAAGCGVVGPEICTLELGWTVRPTEATLRVGETVVVSASAWTCGGKKELEVDMRWTTADTTIIIVGQRSGLVVAIGTGNAVLNGEDLGPYGIGPVEVPIDVLTGGE